MEHMNSNLLEVTQSAGLVSDAANHSKGTAHEGDTVVRRSVDAMDTVREDIARMRQQPGFATDAGVRRQSLSALQAEIEQWPVNASTSEAWAKRWASQLGSQGVFVRSSSSSEDLPNFSGAGLYTTVPNVRSGTDLAAAVRKVWASVYNFEAWEARQAAGIDDAQVMMSVFVQKAVDSSASGVMITRDPFDASHRYMSYIAAKRGIGIRVVEGRRVAEQILYSSRSKAVQVLNRSQDDVALQLDARGGVREVAVTAGRAVLSDALVQRLARWAMGFLPKTEPWQTRREKWLEQLDTLATESRLLLADKGRCARILAVQTLKLFLMFTLPWFCIRFMGLSCGLSFWQVQLLTSLMLFLSNALPNVAGMGSIETAFLLVFGSFLERGEVMSVMMLYRIASYYVVFAASAVGFFFAQRHLGQMGAEPPKED